jgi:hypothetical protein
MWGHYESRIVRVFLGPLNEVLGLTTNILSIHILPTTDIDLPSMEDYAPFFF